MNDLLRVCLLGAGQTVAVNRAGGMASKLLQTLGYRAPSPAEEQQFLAGSRADRDERTTLVPAAVLSADPLISYSGIVPKAPLGVATLSGTCLAARNAWFLISPTWSIETDEAASKLRECAVLHRIANRHHRLIFICNTPEEAAIMQKQDEAAFYYNKTANVLQTLFRPLPGARAIYDAVYNAQLSPWKRHELSMGVERCAFLFYRDGSSPDAAASQAAIMLRHAAVPGHVFINPLDENQRPVRLSPRRVNEFLNQASVGLCLSRIEGAMFASTEYLLSGLPIVSTPSIGGRHVYYDEEYCWTVPPDPASVAAAVDALKDKRIPRSYVRKKTLRRLDVDRERFLNLVNAILEECQSDSRLAMPWPFKKQVTMEWLAAAEAVRRAKEGVVDGFEKKGKVRLPWYRRLFGRFR
ncbi:MAG TPA: glycosyltransferase [Rhizobiaceae bacterium]